MAGIATPEILRREGSQGSLYRQCARDYLTTLILNEIVHIKGYGLDSYNRVLAVVYINGKNINLEMLRAGLAEVCRKELPKGLDLGPYRSVEAEARKARRGIWVLGKR